LPRMSLLGPKMRFHGRAPWEMEEDALQEEEEEQPQQNYDTLLSVTMRGLGLSSSRRGSPSRPSTESARSQVNSHRSFETTPIQRSHMNDSPQ
jgi:hypothetical protein